MSSDWGYMKKNNPLDVPTDASSLETQIMQSQHTLQQRHCSALCTLGTWVSGGVFIIDEF